MGLFDRVYCNRPEFVCSEGHDLSDAEFQTKDLGETMGSATIDDRFDFNDGGWGDPIARPFTGDIEVYSDCHQCPAFVQAETFNLHPVSVEFVVRVESDAVVLVTRTSASTVEQIEQAPKLDYMPNCRGPMSYEDAQKRHMDRKFFPWDPVPIVDEETKGRQAAWKERLAKWRRPRV